MCSQAHQLGDHSLDLNPLGARLGPAILKRLESLDLADNILKYEGALRLWRAARDLPALVCVDMQRSGIEHAFRHDLYAATRSACRSADILVL